MLSLLIQYMDGGHRSAGAVFTDWLILTIGKGNLKPVCICSGKLNSICSYLHTCMHVMYANACRNTPRVSFGRAQRCVSISGCFFFTPQWWLFLCISNSYILVLSSWNEICSPEEIERRKERRGKWARELRRTECQGLPSRDFFWLSLPKKTRAKQCASAGLQIPLAPKGWLLGKDV